MESRPKRRRTTSPSATQNTQVSGPNTYAQDMVQQCHTDKMPTLRDTVSNPDDFSSISATPPTFVGSTYQEPSISSLPHPTVSTGNTYQTQNVLHDSMEQETDMDLDSKDLFVINLAEYFSREDKDQKLLEDTIFLLEILQKQESSHFSDRIIHESHVVGSVGECLSILDLYSNNRDLDIMLVRTLIAATERHSVEENIFFQIDDTDTLPGYVKLELKIKDIMKSKVFRFFYSSYKLQQENAEINNNEAGVWEKCFKLLGSDLSINFFSNGPACSADMDFGFQNISVDCVEAVKCKEWPRIADEWLERPRKYDWPTGGLIEEVVETRCYLVPVGGHKSPQNHLEWRISFALAERLLIRRMSPVMRFVLLFLKTIKNEVFGRFSDVISSYIIKTTIMWVCEENDVPSWNFKMILQYVKLCFSKILYFLETNCCPNYFMRTCNLFHAKFSEHDRLALIDIVEKTLNTPRFLETLEGMKSMHNARLFVSFLRQIGWNIRNIILCRSLSENLINQVIRVVFNKKEEKKPIVAKKWLAHLLNTVKKNKLSVVFEEILSETLATLQIRAEAVEIYKKKLSKQESFNSLRHLIEDHKLQALDMSVGGLTQIAHVFFSLGLVENCARLVLPIVGMNLSKPQIKFENLDFMNVFKLLVVLLSCNRYDLSFSSPVRPVFDIQFYPFEFPMLTRDLQIECFCLKVQQRYYSKMDTYVRNISFSVSLHPGVYACYLKFKCMRCVDAFGADIALTEFEKLVQMGITHRHTALNLFACCLWECGHKERALLMLGRSVRENSLRIASYCHIAIMLNHEMHA